MERFKMDRLMENMRLTIKGLKKGVRRLKVMERRGMYSFCFTAIKRLAGAGNVIAPNTYRIPNNVLVSYVCKSWRGGVRIVS